MEESDPLDEALSIRFHELEHKIAQEQSYDELVAAYHAIGDEFVPRYEARNQSDKALYTRQSVAASILLITKLADRPLDECLTRFHRLLELGFPDLHHEAHEIIAFSGYWLRRGGDGEAIREYLEPLRARLEDEYQRTGDPMWSGHLERYDAVMARL